MERYGVSSGSLNSALTYGYSTGGYHFYYADEPKPPNSHFKRAVYCEDLDTVFTSLETCADAIGFNGSISDLADKVANGTVVKGHRLGFVGVDRKPLPNGDKWKPAVTDAKRENMQVGRVSSPLYGKQSVKPARLQEWLGTICEYENAVSKPATERITGIRPDGAIFLRRQIAATELLSLADRYGEYLDFADEAADLQHAALENVYGSEFTDALESGYDLNAESHDCASGSAVLETCDTTRAEQPTNHVKGVR